MASLAQQIAALPYRRATDGTLEVLLITSRETGRWVVPKGNPIRGLSPHQAAAREAFEEAGISGIPCPAPLGSFRYDKRRRRGVQRMEVTLFPLAVLRQFDDWPEREQRTTRWFTPADAALAVDEPELRALIASFRQPPESAGRAERALLWVRARSGERVGIVRWFQALMPKNGRFFELFEAHAQTLVDGADALARILNGDIAITEGAAAVQAHEHRADDITRDVLQDVRRIFVTPFDRSAITSLIGSMDDALDQMNQTAKAITLYEIDSFSPEMRDMCGIISEAARITAEAMPLLRSVGANASKLHMLTERLVTIEGHADEIHDSGLKALFKAHKNVGGLEFFTGREVYSHLERVVDRFEDVANEIQGLVIDHA